MMLFLIGFSLVWYNTNFLTAFGVVLLIGSAMETVQEWVKK